MDLLNYQDKFFLFTTPAKPKNMAIDFYDYGELKSGFAGWRVSGTVRNKRYQKYFSIRNTHPFIRDSEWNEYQRLRAQHYYARLRMRSFAAQYFDQLRSDHPRTLAGRGLGFRGVTLGILRNPGSERYHCQFIVNLREQTQRFVINAEQSFDAAWDLAIDQWTSAFEIRKKDADRIRKEKKPGPDAFKYLRRIMNGEGQNIPVDALHFVFAHQRAELKRRKVSETLQGRNGSSSDDFWGEQELGEFAAHLAQEIERHKGRSQA